MHHVRLEFLLPIYEFLMGTRGQGEGVLTVVLLVLAARAVRGELQTRRRVVVFVGLFALAATLRALVPWCVGNDYSDFETPYLNYGLNEQYVSPLYDHFVWFFSTWPRAPFAANFLLGSLLPPVLFLVLDRPSKGPKVALVFAAIVAVLPYYVRLSAGDAPHVFAVLALAAGLLGFARLLERRTVADAVLVVVGIHLMLATRMELASAVMFFPALGLWLRGREFAARGALRPLALVAAGTLLGVLFSNHALRAGLNSPLALKWDYWRIYLGNVPTVLTWSGGSTLPHPLFQLGVWALVVGAVLLRRRALLAAYVVGTIVLSAPYALDAPFAAAVMSPIGIWSFARYAAAWMLYPAFFTAVGLVLCWEACARARRAVVLRRALALVVAGVLAAGVPTYAIIHPYQAEYLMLRDFLDARDDRVPLLVGWVKHVTVDLHDSLSLPHYALGTTEPRQWRILGPKSRVSDVVTPGEGPLHYFANSTSALGPYAHDLPGGDHKLVEAVRRYSALRCVVEANGELLASWDTRTHERDSAPPWQRPTVRWQHGSWAPLTLAIYRIDSDYRRWRQVDECGARSWFEE